MMLKLLVILNGALLAAITFVVLTRPVMASPQPALTPEQMTQIHAHQADEAVKAARQMGMEICKIDVDATHYEVVAKLPGTACTDTDRK